MYRDFLFICLFLTKGFMYLSYVLRITIKTPSCTSIKTNCFAHDELIIITCLQQGFRILQKHTNNICSLTYLILIKHLRHLSTLQDNYRKIEEITRKVVLFQTHPHQVVLNVFVEYL